jgi:hypothetical protein
MRLIRILLLAIASSDAYHAACRPATAGAKLIMAAGGNKQSSATRREVVSGDSMYKSFVKGGGGEVLLGVIAASVAAYGGTRRDALKDEVAMLDASSAISATPHLPSVVLSPSGANGRVSCEITAPTVAAPDRIDFIWLKDVNSGEILAAKKVSSASQQQAVLSLALEKGRRAQPVVHCTDGITIGDEFVATTKP